MKTFIKTCVALTATMGLGVAAAPPASAEAADFFKCKMREGTTIEQVTAVIRVFVKDARKNGYDKYSVRFLMPVYSNDISAGVFWWVGVDKDLGSLASGNEYWVSEKNRSHREKFNALIKDCESSSLHQVIEVKAAD
jgi:hypothetical protein